MASPPPTLTPELAARFAEVALGHVRREYPNKLDHVLDGPADALGPRDLHPLFYGSFDWHSCVHGYWTLATLRPLTPPAVAARIEALFDAAITPEAVEGERAYLRRPSARGFERQYGWAWLLALQTALDGTRWGETLRPLAQDFADRWRAFLPLADYPVRSGAHGNTAFALLLSRRYAVGAGDAELARSVAAKARAWYGADRAAPAWEPSGDDFLSPTLVEAALMAEALEPAESVAWLAAFLPGLASGEPAALFAPARVSDRADGKIAHLDGLNLSRAWCWRLLAPWLGDEAAARARAAAAAHLEASLPHVAGDYMGEHWLATFAVLALADPRG